MLSGGSGGKGQSCGRVFGETHERDESGNPLYIRDVRSTVLQMTISFPFLPFPFLALTADFVKLLHSINRSHDRLKTESRQARLENARLKRLLQEKDDRAKV